MFIYSNSFRIAVQKDGSDVLVTFVQDQPLYGDNGKVTGTRREDVGEFAIPLNIALDLAKNIEKLVEPQN